MTTVYPLVQMITRLSAIVPTFSSWETCALSLIEKNRPKSVSFICKSSQHCPSNNLYKMLQIPSQTIYELEPDEWPTFRFSELVFVTDDDIISLSNHTVNKYRGKGKNEFNFVIVAKMKNYDDDFKVMGDLFADMWIAGIVKCAVILVNETSSRLFTYLPFKNNMSCEDTTPILLGECANGVDTVFDLKYKVFDLNQCPIRITLVDDRPFLQFPVRGRLSSLVYEIALRMNATIESMMPTSGGGGATCGPEEFTGTRGQVWNGQAHMAVGSFNRKECSTLEFISLAFTQCMSWCTPVLSASDYVYLFIVKQLQPKVWGALILSVIVVVTSVIFLCSVTREHFTGNDAFNLALVIYAQPPPLEPRTTPIRVILVVWLWACLVVRTAYEGELKSQSAVQLGSHIIYSLEELAGMDILLCSAKANLQNFWEEEQPIIQKINKKSKICNGSLYENMAAAVRQKDRAVLTSDLRCSVTSSEINQDESGLYSLTGGCFKTYQVAPIITVPGSPFKNRWRVIMDRCTQAGLIIKWLDIKPPTRGVRGVQPYSLGHILPALFVLGVGCLVGVLVLIGETICDKCCQPEPDFKVHSY